MWYSLPRTLLRRIFSEPGFFKSGLIKGPPSQSILQSSSSPLPHHYHFDLFSLPRTYTISKSLPCLLSVCLLWSRLCLQGRVVQKFINELMKCLFCLPHPFGLVSPPVFLGCYGGFQLRGQLDPFDQLPSYPSQLRGREPRARAAAAPGGLSSRPGRTRPGSHPAPCLAP